jgi:hypothetical protein
LAWPAITWAVFSTKSQFCTFSVKLKLVFAVSPLKSGIYYVIILLQLWPKKKRFLAAAPNTTGVDVAPASANDARWYRAFVKQRPPPELVNLVLPPSGFDQEQKKNPI